MATWTSHDSTTDAQNESRDILADDGRTIAVLEQYCHDDDMPDWTPDEVASHARLISAAPELLAACVLANAVLADISHYVPDEEFDGSSDPNTARDALADAIAKATPQ